MAIEIVVPRLGWSMEEGTFAEWLKHDGDEVAAGEMLFVLEGEKAAQEIESFDSGVLRIPPDSPSPGESVTVGQLLAYLVDPNEAATFQFPASVRSNRALPTTASNWKPAARRVAGPGARRLARELGVDLRDVPTSDPTGRVRAEDIRSRSSLSPQPLHRPPTTKVAITPRARRLARDRDLDWTAIEGTGRNGRIRERDIFAHAKKSSATTARRDAPSAPGTRLPSSKIRRTIAQRTLAGALQTAPVTLTTKVEAAALVDVRNKCEPRAGHVTPSYNDMIVRLVALTLQERPELNSCWHDDAVFVYRDVNIAIAIDSETGLVAPVIRNTPALSLSEIAEQTQSLAQTARDGALAEQQLCGGTFTVTNLGMFGIDFFTPIINLPQTAILGVGRLVQEPVITDNRVVPGYSISLSLTFDHRAVDGAPAARWLQRLSELIQQASQWLA